MTHIIDDHFEINLVAYLLNQIYVVPVPPPQYDYDDSHANVIDEVTTEPTAPLHIFFSFQCVIYIYVKHIEMRKKYVVVAVGSVVLILGGIN